MPRSSLPFTLLLAPLLAALALPAWRFGPARPATSAAVPAQDTPVATPTPTNWLAEALFQGVVVDAAATGQPPIDGARVFVQMVDAPCDRSVWTDAEGRFALRCRDIHYFEHGQRLYAYAAGYGSWSWRGEIAQPTRTLRIELRSPSGDATATPTPADELTNVVTHGSVTRSHDGRPIAGARIEAIVGPGACLSPVFSDNMGRYEIICPRASSIGTVTYRASARGFRDWSRSVQGTFAGGRMDIEMDLVSLPPTATTSATPSPSATAGTPPAPSASTTPSPTPTASGTPSATPDGPAPIYIPLVRRSRLAE